MTQLRQQSAMNLKYIQRKWSYEGGREWTGVLNESCVRFTLKSEKGRVGEVFY